MESIAIVNFMKGSKGQSRGGMAAVMRYASQDEKTKWGGMKLVSGVNCQARSTYNNFLRTQLLHHKDNGRRFYHLVQSFPKGEKVDPQQAHLAARRLAEFFEDREVLVCTHTDRDHIHSHLIINAVALESGRKLHSDKKLIQELMKFNVKVCMEFQLPVFQPAQHKKKTKSLSNAEYHAAAKGESWKFQMMNVIDNCMRYAVSREEFIELMRSEGYEVKWMPSRKNITYTTPGGKKCRDRMLHEEKYLKEKMEFEFAIRKAIIYGRTEAEEQGHAATDDASSRAASGTVAANAAGGAAVTDRERYRDGQHDQPAEAAPLRHRIAPDQRAVGEVVGYDGFDREIGNVTDPTVGADLRAALDTVFSAAGNDEEQSDAIADGNSAQGCDSIEMYGPTGWEEEREALLDFLHQTATVEMESAVHPNPDGGGGIAGNIVRLGRSLEMSQPPVMDATTSHSQTDRMAMKKIKEKNRSGPRQER